MSDRISNEEIEELMSSLGFKLNHVDWYRDNINAGMAGLELLDSIPLQGSESRNERVWEVPGKSDNPFNAWAVKSNILILNQ